jgi:hypothetical protein
MLTHVWTPSDLQTDQKSTYQPYRFHDNHDIDASPLNNFE